MSSIELGNKFKTSYEKISGLNPEQRVGLLESLNTSEQQNTDIIKSVIRSDGCFNLFTLKDKSSHSRSKVYNELKRLSDSFSETQVKDLCDFFSAFDSLFSKGINGILSSIEEKDQQKLIEESTKLDSSPLIKFKKSIRSAAGGFISFIGLGVFYILAQIVKINITFLISSFGIDLSNSIFSNLIKILLGWSIAGIIIMSVGIFFVYCLDDKPKINNEELELKPFEKRRKTCKPILIGALVGLGSPIVFSAIYSIRQKSWQIFASTIWIVIATNLFIISPAIDMSGSKKYPVQIICGIAAYLIARRNKKELISFR